MYVAYVQNGPKTGTLCFVRLNFVRYRPIFKLISLSESGEQFGVTSYGALGHVSPPPELGHVKNLGSFYVHNILSSPILQ